MNTDALFAWAAFGQYCAIAGGTWLVVRIGIHVLARLYARTHPPVDTRPLHQRRPNDV